MHPSDLTQIKATRPASAYRTKKKQPHFVAMDSEFSIEPLTKQLVRTAYPFAQALGIADFESWCTFVERHRAEAMEEAGSLAVRNAQGYVCGLLFYRIDRRNGKGAALVCDHLVAADMPGREKPFRALLDAANRIAAERDCRWIRVAIPANGDPFGIQTTGLEASLFRAGYALENLSFRRRLTTPQRQCAADESAAAPGKPDNST